jgi:hypothetical protein
LPALAGVVRQKLSENYRCLYLNSPAMVAGMRSYLAAAGVDVAFESKKGSLILTSEQPHLSGGVFDADGMIETLARSVEAALAAGYAGLFATGDMTWELGPDQDLGKLVHYELSLEELFHRYPQLSGICQYHADTLPRQFVKDGLFSHGAIFVNQTLSRVNPYHLHTNARREPMATLNAEVENFLLRTLPHTPR